MNLRWTLSLLVLFLTGCASYQHKIDKPYSLILRGQPLEAAQILKPLAYTEGNDQLVYLLEYGIALHEAGDYAESTKVLLRAYDIVEIKDYTSISKEAGSLLLNQEMVQYKGEDFEKVLVNVYLALNFLMVGNLEAAQVETRRINEILTKFKIEAKKDYDQNPFARYLSAMIWESNRNWDSTYIDYKNTYDLAPNLKLLESDLLWAAKRSQRPEEFKKWRALFKEAQVDKLRDEKGTGEIVFIYQQGQGPQKRPDPGFPRVARLYPRYSTGVKSKMSIFEADSETPIHEVVTEKVLSVQDVAMKTYNDQVDGLIAKRVAGIATKAVVSDQIRQKNEGLGNLAWIIMNISDRADLRQWATLPESFQIARKFLKPGKYRVSLRALSSSDAPLNEGAEYKEVEVKPGKKTFLTWRSFR